MKLYRFSPIGNEADLLKAIHYVHTVCFKLCGESFGQYLPVAGNIAIFCHYDHEHERLVTIRDTLIEPTAESGLKYRKLVSPIVINAQGNIPGATYTHLYIRKPDPYRHYVGDIDFFVESEEYATLKQSVREGNISGARIFPRSDLDMIELYSPDVDVLAYVTPHTIDEKAEIKLPHETNH